ncbi:unnamed protein product [Phyllotreta striolata]|uniref:Gustatory receptor n=1 Tax=Phyllotreta striolata TaxID=444603 RepID=A0A9N9TK94_PHYSR|nr:unnamed protein product [Phyllotreta striolata]
MGVYPAVVKKDRKLATFLYKLYLILIGCLIGLTFAISFYTRLNFAFKTNQLTHNIVDSLAMFNELLFVVRSICNVEQCLNLTNFALNKRDTWWLFSQSVLIHVLFFVIHIRQMILKFETGDYQFLYYQLYHVVTMYHQIVILQTVTLTNRFLTIRYRFLRTYLDSIIRNEKSCFIVLKSYKKLKLKDAFVLFKRLSKVSFYLSKTFEKHVFLATWATVLINLNCIVFLIYVDDNETSDIFIYFAHNVIYSISYMVAALHSENVESESTKIIKSCYENQETLSGNRLESELMRFGEICGQLTPRFTVAGFFYFNKSVLSSVFSSILTYLIIIIQFDITLKKP